MFTIVVSEKGGAERREVFDRPEISVGRVQGNELMLPKGNVSKRHARLLLREGRFIVTDLNSTNGTYVNRRRISQPTIVKQGDKIYIGDFLLRIELPASDAEAPLSPREVSSTGSAPAAAASLTDESVSGAAAAFAVEREEESSSSTAKAQVSRLPPNKPRPNPVQARPRQTGFESAEASVPVPRSPLVSSQPDVESLLHRSALVALVDRVVVALDPDALEHDPVASLAPRVHELVWSNLRAMQSEAQIPPELSPEQLAHDAEAELVDTGPLAPLLEDEDTTDVAVLGCHQIVAVRNGQSCPLEVSFSSDTSLRRAVMRLCRRAGVPLDDMETVVERRLLGGGMMWAAFEPATVNGSIVLIRKIRRIALTLEELVEHGAISHGMATFFEQCMAARVNLLVVGPRDPGTAAVVSALCAAVGPDHVIALEDIEDVVAGVRHVTRLSATRIRHQAAQLVALAAHVPDARVVAELGTPELAGAVLETVGAGTQGLVAVVRASGLRRGLSRLVAELMVSRPGLTVGAAREWVASGFGVALEVRRLRDGRYRVVSVCELDGSGSDEIRAQEVFSFSVDRSSPSGDIEGTFHASGSVPRIVDEITSRGIQVDSSVFKRS